MIIVRVPLRITLGGGGTDLPSFATKYGGFCVSASISKYVYVGVNKTFKEEINLKYSEYEYVKSTDEIKHPIFKEALDWAKFNTPQIEIFSVADVPSSGAGLGNSGAFTVALIKALSSHKNISLSNKEVADIACMINMEKLKKTQGKQDEYACAIGGINSFDFLPNGEVYFSPINMKFDRMKELEENLLLFYSKKLHTTEDILKFQEENTENNNIDMINNLEKTKEIGYLSKDYLESGKLQRFGELLNLQWKVKEARMPHSDNFLVKIHNGFNAHGAIGNKIIGSGMGGFFLVYTTTSQSVRDYAKAKGLEELYFQFDFEGCKRLV